ncbi:MAG: UDP-N-acetylmuramate dehydrogenase [Candidatus Omnitrophota bacterium]
MAESSSLAYINNTVFLKDMTHFKIGGLCRHFFIAHTFDDLQHIFKNFIQQGDEFHFLGAGSNLLINDGEVTKPVVTLGKEFQYIKKLKECFFEIGAGVRLSQIIFNCLKDNLGGLENLVGIPASMGGLVATNAGSFGKDISSCMEEAVVFTREEGILRLKKEDIHFGYRYSSLRGKIILNCRIRFQKDNNVKKNIMSYLKRRLSSQDFLHPSAGCIFKNTTAASAGLLIERCGLKGFTVGAAQVSQKHANFIVNLGGASAKDVAVLISLIKEKVYNKFGIELEEEIERWEI